MTSFNVFYTVYLKKNFMRIFTVFLFALCLSGCGKDIPPPTYLRIDEYTLEPNIDLNMGQLTHGIMDVWVYIDNENYGVFPVPCVIPLNLEGVKEVRLQAGVRSNGNSAKKIKYPFFEHHVETVNFKRLDTIHIQPKTKYYSTTQVWYEDFEDAAVQINSTPLSNVELIKSSDPNILQARNGNFFGFVQLTEEQNFWDAVTNANWSIPVNRPAYLEIDFYNTNPIQTGLRSTGSAGLNNMMHVLIVNQKPEELRWRKMYIDLSQMVAAVGVGNTFNFMMSSIRMDGVEDTFLAIDNIKLVYR